MNRNLRLVDQSCWSILGEKNHATDPFYAAMSPDVGCNVWVLVRSDVYPGTHGESSITEAKSLYLYVNNEA